MGIKNFTVTTQRIKSKSDGLIEYTNYLVSENAPSHKNTTILNIGRNFDHFLQNTIINTVNFDNENKKGGRKVESYAQSFNFILPPDVAKPTHEEWKCIYLDLLKKAKETLEIKGDLKPLAKSCFSNVHDQSNPHLNLLIPRIYNNERLHGLDQRKLLSELKKEFNKSVMIHCNIDFRSYKSEQQNIGKRRKKWQMDQKKFHEERDKLAQERLDLSQEILAAAEASKASEDAALAALEAESRALKAKKELEHTMSIFGEMQNLFYKFKETLTDWIKFHKNKDPILEPESRHEVLDTVDLMQKNEYYDEQTEDFIFNSLEQAEDETGGSIKGNARRKFKI